MDAVAPGLLVAQTLGRIGNYFNQKLFGDPTKLPLGLDIARHIDRLARRGCDLPTHLSQRADLRPRPRRAPDHARPHGSLPCSGTVGLYVAGCSGFRIFEELVRVDPVHHILG